MQHRIKIKTPDGTLKEQLFDDFNEFAETIEDMALDYYANGVNTPQYDVETLYDNMTRTEKVTNGFDTEDFGKAEFIGE